MIELESRADLYNKAFPKRPPIAFGNGMMSGCWMIGACYKNPNPLYGAYPHGYLERVHTMFPDARNVLHVFSGGLTQDAATSEWVKAVPQVGDGTQVVYPPELVDIHGPEQGRFPTWQGNLHEMPNEWNDRFDLILADPPYSADDAKLYDCPPPNRGKIMQSLHRVAKPGGNLVWLDQVWPMHKKAQWKTWGTVGLVRSTNHRMRLVSFFEAQ